MRGFLFIFSFIFFLCVNSSYGQSQYLIEKSKEELQGPLLDQYEYMLDKSFNSSIDSVPFESIKVRYLKAFKIHLSDSLLKLETNILSLENNRDSLVKQLSKNQENLSKIQSENSRLLANQDHISLLGISLTKGGYHALVWSIIFALILIVVYLSSLVKKSRDEVKEVVEDAESSQKELDNFRRASMEREQKLNREILDLNKKLEKPFDSSTTKSAPKEKPESKTKSIGSKKSTNK